MQLIVVNDMSSVIKIQPLDQKISYTSKGAIDSANVFASETDTYSTIWFLWEGNGSVSDASIA